MDIIKQNRKIIGNLLDNLYKERREVSFQKGPLSRKFKRVKAVLRIRAGYWLNHDNASLMDHDVDLCNIDQLYDLSETIDLHTDDFLIEYPESIKRLINFGSINLNRLFGQNKTELYNFYYNNFVNHKNIDNKNNNNSNNKN